jgi:D-aminopeptidase
MRCQGFKSGVGTSSRRAGDTGFTIGVLVVPNFGFPGDLVIAGVPVGRMLETVGQPSERGSCIFVLGTDAPLASGDLRRLAWRCFLGMARTGAISGQTSGDLAIAVSTTPRQLRVDRTVMNALFRAAVESSEEAILNALFMAETTTGRDGHLMPALPLPEVMMILRRHGVQVRGVGQET